MNSILTALFVLVYIICINLISHVDLIFDISHYYYVLEILSLIMTLVIIAYYMFGLKQIKLTFMAIILSILFFNAYFLLLFFALSTIFIRSIFINKDNILIFDIMAYISYSIILYYLMIGLLDVWPTVILMLIMSTTIVSNSKKEDLIKSTKIETSLFFAFFIIFSTISYLF
ncbi:MAG: hypothetical protein ACK5HS_00625 [Mycoplasmatales bacterium]